MILSFSGGSWIGICYYIGTASYIVDHHDLTDLVTLGASAGAWAALTLQLRDHVDLNRLKDSLYKYMDSLPTIPQGCEEGIRDLFDQNFGHIEDDVVARIGDKLHISVTVWSGWRYRNKILSGFKTITQIRDALIHSSRVPGFIGYDPRNIDGGFTNNQPTLGTDTITVCCIKTLGGDICPSEYMNPMYFLVPPPLEIREKLIVLGFENTRDYFNNLSQLKVITFDDDDDDDEDDQKERLSLLFE